MPTALSWWPVAPAGMQAWWLNILLKNSAASLWKWNMHLNSVTATRLFNKGDIIIAISQSGETADTLVAIEKAKEKGAIIFGIVNVVGSSIARISSWRRLYTCRT